MHTAHFHASPLSSFFLYRFVSIFFLCRVANKIRAFLDKGNYANWKTIKRITCFLLCGPTAYVFVSVSERFTKKRSLTDLDCWSEQTSFFLCPDIHFISASVCVTVAECCVLKLQETLKLTSFLWHLTSVFKRLTFWPTGDNGST